MVAESEGGPPEGGPKQNKSISLYNTPRILHGYKFRSKFLLQPVQVASSLTAVSSAKVPVPRWGVRGVTRDKNFFISS
jgi:hypothetical protein